MNRKFWCGTSCGLLPKTVWKWSESLWSELWTLVVAPGTNTVGLYESKGWHFVHIHQKRLCSYNLFVANLGESEHLYVPFFSFLLPYTSECIVTPTSWFPSSTESVKVVSTFLYTIPFSCSLFLSVEDAHAVFHCPLKPDLPSLVVLLLSGFGDSCRAPLRVTTFPTWPWGQLHATSSLQMPMTPPRVTWWARSCV